MDVPDGKAAQTAGRRRPSLEERRPPGYISIAFLTGLVLMPLVIGAGFVTDRSLDPAVPPDIAGAVLRGPIDLNMPIPALRGSMSA